MPVKGRSVIAMKFGPGEYDEIKLDGKKEGIVTIDGLSRLLIERGAGFLEALDRFVHLIEPMKDRVTRQQWQRFQEAVAISRADLQA
jgi:hypothetical protein